ncbi:MAG TPA: HIT family protein [Dehalococcoidia bacterium]|nr:HIT family protein [Dehalococcoidia bacterium]
MPDQGPLETGPCPFCDIAGLSTVLLETENFFVIGDHAPIAPAHLLLIPRDHYPHLAALPEALDDEFESLKGRLGDFVAGQFGRVAFWENGVFGQTVPHAHLHVVSMNLDASLFAGAGPTFSGLAGLRRLYAVEPRHYFTLEQDGVAHFLPPDPQLYVRIIHHGQAVNPHWVPDREERRRRGSAVFNALRERWESYFGVTRTSG